MRELGDKLLALLSILWVPCFGIAVWQGIMHNWFWTGVAVGGFILSHIMKTLKNHLEAKKLRMMMKKKFEGRETPLKGRSRLIVEERNNVHDIKPQEW